MSAEFDGSLDAVNASFDDDPVFETSSYAVLEVNGLLFAFSSVDDFSRAGVQGMMASSTFTWSKIAYGSTKMKTCPMPSTKLPGPWRGRAVDLHSAG